MASVGTRSIVAITVASMLLPATLPGQAGDTAIVPSAVAVTPQQPRSIARLATGGVLLGTAGFFGGALAGAGLCGCHEADGYDILAAAFLGASAGAAIGIPLGIHLANDARGNLGYSLLASAAVTTAGLLVALSSDGDALTGAVVIAIPVTAIITSIALERRTTR